MNRTRWMLGALAATGVLACATGICRADDEEAAVRKTVQSYVAAFNRGDAAALAAQWAEDGVVVTPAGQTLKGRKAIQEAFAAYFKESPGAKIEVQVASLRVEGPEVATEEGTARVKGADSPATETTYTARYVKRDGKWLLASIREADAPPTHYEQLKELEWLVGEWEDKEGDASVQMTCRWTKNRNFLTRSFAASIGDHTDLEGTQVIGWDPSKKVIRSWLFDSDGSFGAGAWSRKGDRWTIQALQVLSDGRKASSLNVLRKVDDDTFTWESTGREVGGEVLPNLGPVTVVRKKSAQ